MNENGEILGFGHGGADKGFMSQLYLELDTDNGYFFANNGSSIRFEGIDNSDGGLVKTLVMDGNKRGERIESPASFATE